MCFEKAFFFPLPLLSPHKKVCFFFLKGKNKENGTPSLGLPGLTLLSSRLLPPQPSSLSPPPPHRRQGFSSHHRQRALEEPDSSRAVHQSQVRARGWGRRLVGKEKGGFSCTHTTGAHLHIHHFFFSTSSSVSFFFFTRL